jgi:hypothetical protein
MAAERQYTTQLQAGLGMVQESLVLLDLWQPGDIPSHLAQRAIDAGLFSRTTARRARNLAAEMFAPRFLADGAEAARRIKFLAEHRFPKDALIQLFFLQTARAQAIFADFVVELYWPKYSAGASVLTKSDAERFIRRALDAGRMQKRWTPATTHRVSGYLIGCCIDFGLLTGTRGNGKPIQSFSIRREVGLYLAYDLHFAGHSDMAVVTHSDWTLFGLESSEVVGLLKGLAQDGHMLVQSSAELVQISWPYKTEEDFLNALTKG